MTEYYSKLKYLRRHKSYFTAIFRSTQNYWYNKRITLRSILALNNSKLTAAPPLHNQATKNFCCISK